MSHFLAVNHESYDGDSIFGVFDDLALAQRFLDSPDAENVSCTARYAEIEEWDGVNLVATFARRGGEWCEVWRRPTHPIPTRRAMTLQHEDGTREYSPDVEVIDEGEVRVTIRPVIPFRRLLSATEPTEGRTS